MKQSDETGTPPSLADPGRLRALARTGLTAVPDAPLDRFAALVRKVLAVPVALVTMVDDGGQFFPGAAGDGAPWATSRATDLSHSFCQHVTLSAQPFVVTDARTDRRICHNLAIADLGVIGYAGMPLTDDDGNVLGSLCAIDSRPRGWTDAELDILADLAAGCSAEIRLRIAAHHAEQSRRRADLLLHASEQLSRTSGVADVVATVTGLVGGRLGPAHVSIAWWEDRRHHLTVVTGQLDRDCADVPKPGAGQPTATAMRERRALFFADRAEFAAAFPDVVDELTQRDWHAFACAPLLGTSAVLGALRLAWAAPRPFDVGERAVITTLAGYVTQAIERAQQFDARITAAETLQRAMISPLPAAAPLQLAARYQPGAVGEQIGGDWYDAVARADGRLAVVIGDVAGHDMTAAAKMGQLRNMLRAYLIDRQEPPSALLRRLDTANHLLGDRAVATALVAFVSPAAADTWHVQWSSAGHPAPLLVHPDGRVEPLAGSDLLLGVLPFAPRRNHARVLPAGSTLLLHTDGLIDTCSDTPDDEPARLYDRLRVLADAPVDELVAGLLDRPTTGKSDDIAVLAVRLPP